jgi:hypothetical protein
MSPNQHLVRFAGLSSFRRSETKYMKLMPLDDSRWATYSGGYKSPYNVVPLIYRLSDKGTSGDFWEVVWNELHHQGDVGEASYAFVPYLVARRRAAIQPGAARNGNTQRQLIGNPPRNPQGGSVRHRPWQPTGRRPDACARNQENRK